MCSASWTKISCMCVELVLGCGCKNVNKWNIERIVEQYKKKADKEKKLW